MMRKYTLVEVIALVVFVGYSVTYSLHVAHIFREVDSDAKELTDREERTAGQTHLTSFQAEST